MATRVRELTFNDFASMKTKLELLLSQDTTVAASQVDYERDGTNILCVVRQLYVALTQAAVGTPVLDDATFAGTYTGSEDTLIVVEIDGTGTPDTYSVTRDGVALSTGNNITGIGALTIVDGITIQFGATTGHTSGDSWQAWYMIE